MTRLDLRWFAGSAVSRGRQLSRVNYRLEFNEEALAQLLVLPREARWRIGFRLDVLQENLQGDVKKLAGQLGKYRLKVGDYRVLFALQKT